MLAATSNRSTLLVLLFRAFRLLITSNVSSSPILVILMIEALRTSETSAVRKAMLRNIPEGGILCGQQRYNFKCYVALTDWSL
jgi:hypothetical protein